MSALARTLTDEPSLLSEATETELPTVNSCNTLRLPPINALQELDKDEPARTNALIEIALPTMAAPVLLSDPCVAIEDPLTHKLDSITTLSTTLVYPQDPNLAKPKADKELPSRTKHLTLALLPASVLPPTELELPIRLTSVTDMVLPNRINDLSENALPNST
jgi:hypothetical protein